MEVAHKFLACGGLEHGFARMIVSPEARAGALSEFECVPVLWQTAHDDLNAATTGFLARHDGLGGCETSILARHDGFRGCETSILVVTGAPLSPQRDRSAPRPRSFARLSNSIVPRRLR